MNKLRSEFVNRVFNLNSVALNSARSYSVGVIGAPFWNGQSKPGTDLAPNFLRSQGLLTKLSLIQENVVDFGDLHFYQDGMAPEDIIESSIKVKNKDEFIVGNMCGRLSRLVQNMTAKGFVSLILGGDHSIALGSVNGTCNAKKHLGADISLIWIDAHADVNTANTSQSGHFHGMPVSFLLNEIASSQPALFKELSPCISAKNIVYIGLRDVEMQELKLLKEHNVAYFSMQEVDRLGIREVICRALDIVNPLNKNKLHVSFDVDSIDESLIPSTGTTVVGGLSVREAITIGQTISSTGQMIALDVVELNPNIGTPQQAHQSAKNTIDIVLSFFGKSSLGYYHKNAE